MFCPLCGAPNEDDAIFCGNCGAVLKPEEVPIEGTPDTPAREEEDVAEELDLQEDVISDQDLTAPDLPPPAAAAHPAPPAAPAYPPPPSPAYRAPAASGPSMPTSGLAVASLVLGIGGLTLLPLLGSILAVLFGYMARGEIRRRPGQLSGEGLATAGIVLGWIAIGLAVLGLLVGGAFTICGLCGAFGAGNY